MMFKRQKHRDSHGSRPDAGLAFDAGVHLRSLASRSAYPTLLCAGGAVVFANQAAASLLGVSDSASLEGARLIDFLPHAPQDLLDQCIQVSEGSGNPQVVEAAVRRRDGTFLDVHISAVADLQNGQPVIQLQMLDVTERKRIEAALVWDVGVNAAMASLSDAITSRASSEGLAALVLKHVLQLTDGGLGWVGCLGPEDVGSIPTIAAGTPGFWAVWGIKADAVAPSIDLWWWPLVCEHPLLLNDPSQDPRFLGHPSIHRFLAVPAQTKGGLTCVILLANSSRAFAERDLSVLQLMAARLGTAIERNMIEDRLRESEGRYTSLFDRNHSVMLVIQPDTGDIVDANPAACGFYGWSHAEITAKQIQDINILPHEQILGKLEMAHTGQLRRFGFRHRLASGEVRDVDVHSDPIEVGGRKLLYSIIHEVTEQLQTAEALRASEEKFRTVFQNANDAILLRTIDHEDPNGMGHYVEVNDVACRRLGYTRGELLTMTPRDINATGPNMPMGTAEILARGHATFEMVHVAKDGTRIPVEISAHLFAQGGERYVLSIARDISERKRVEAAMQEAHEKVVGWVRELEVRNREDTLVNELGDLLHTCATHEDAYSVIAHLMLKIFPEASGALYVISASRNMADAACTWGSVPESERVFTPDECWGLRRGRTHLVEDSSSSLLCRHIHEPPLGGYLCIPMVAQGEALGTFHLRSEGGALSESMRRLAPTVAEHVALALANLRLRQTLRDQAVHDQLTGLFNRRYMEEMLEREVSRASRRNAPLGVIMLDVDHFKRFNDIHGHEAGDMLLSALGNHLRTHVRDEDIACRYGGEELILILPDTDQDTTVRKAEQLLEGIRELRVEFRRQVLGPVTVSMGVAAFPTLGKSGTDVVRNADAALYRAKAEGRDRVVSATAVHR